MRANKIQLVLPKQFSVNVLLKVHGHKNGVCPRLLDNDIKTANFGTSALSALSYNSGLLMVGKSHSSKSSTVPSEAFCLPSLLQDKTTPER